MFDFISKFWKLLGPGATSVLIIGGYNFQGLIISSRYNFGPMSKLIAQLFEFWVHSISEVSSFTTSQSPIKDWEDSFSNLNRAQLEPDFEISTKYKSGKFYWSQRSSL